MSEPPSPKWQAMLVVGAMFALPMAFCAFIVWLVSR
jgi:hypothetical protein